VPGAVVKPAIEGAVNRIVTRSSNTERLGDDFVDAGEPLISVGTKKKEPIGDYAKGGPGVATRREPTRVNVHDFADPALGEPAQGDPVWGL
jgi:hypothetical protein